MADVVVMVEAEKNSSEMLAAQIAADLGHDIAAVRSVIAGGAWWAPPARVHPRLEVVPSLAGRSHIGCGDLAGVLAKDVQQDEQVPRAPVQNAI